MKSLGIFSLIMIIPIILIVLNANNELGMFFFLFFAIGIPYFLPSIIGYSRRHPSCHAILALNLFLGLTVIGWVISLVWALRNYKYSALNNAQIHVINATSNSKRNSDSRLPKGYHEDNDATSNDYD